MQVENECDNFALQIKILQSVSMISTSLINLVKLYGGLVLGSSQFLLLPQLPKILLLISKVVTSDLKIIILICWSKSVTHSLYNAQISLIIFYYRWKISTFFLNREI